MSLLIKERRSSSMSFWDCSSASRALSKPDLARAAFCIMCVNPTALSLLYRSLSRLCNSEGEKVTPRHLTVSSAFAIAWLFFWICFPIRAAMDCPSESKSRLELVTLWPIPTLYFFQWRFPRYCCNYTPLWKSWWHFFRYHAVYIVPGCRVPVCWHTHTQTHHHHDSS